MGIHRKREARLPGRRVQSVGWGATAEGGRGKLSTHKLLDSVASVAEMW